MRRLTGFLALSAVVIVGAFVFAGAALAQTSTTMGTRTPAGSTATTMGSTATTSAFGATTATTAMRTTATTVARSAAGSSASRAAAGGVTQARTGARTDTEVLIAGVAFLLGGAFLFFGQPLRRRSLAS